MLKCKKHLINSALTALSTNNKKGAFRPYMPSLRDLDLRVSGTLTRHKLVFIIPIPASTESNLRNPDKNHLCERILALREAGLSLRAIAREVDLHWTRVQQVVKR